MIARTTSSWRTAIQRIDQSLALAWWLDDITLDPKNGNRVFDREHQAVIALSKVNLPVASRAINDLVEADRRLATAQLQIAIDVGGDPKTIARGQQSLADAADDATAGRFDKAVLEYKRAWTNAIKALG